jgi:hypothetical protein
MARACYFWFEAGQFTLAEWGTGAPGESSPMIAAVTAWHRATSASSACNWRVKASTRAMVGSDDPTSPCSAARSRACLRRLYHTSTARRLPRATAFAPAVAGLSRVPGASVLSEGGPARGVLHLSSRETSFAPGSGPPFVSFTYPVPGLCLSAGVSSCRSLRKNPAANFNEINDLRFCSKRIRHPNARRQLVGWRLHAVPAPARRS